MFGRIGGFTADLGESKLTGAVGPNQTNRREDVLVVQQLLNQAIASGALVSLRPIPETGLYDDPTSFAIREVESRYFYGMADPLHRIQPDDEMFHFLVALASEQQISVRQLSGEMYALAARMVPGGADKLVGQKGPTGRKLVRATGTIRTYLPDILVALTRSLSGIASRSDVRHSAKAHGSQEFR